MPHAEGSALIPMGRTRVLCTATVEDRVPGWMRDTGKGWVTAEYGMLPRATGTRTPRTSQTGGRAQEIQRLIGRSLRAVTDLTAFGERTITLDCDVLEADGGTRTAAINGALVALHDAFVTLSNRGALARAPLRDSVAAISVGLVEGVPCLDLDYGEDSRADVDMNVVMTGPRPLHRAAGHRRGRDVQRRRPARAAAPRALRHAASRRARRSSCSAARDCCRPTPSEVRARDLQSRQGARARDRCWRCRVSRSFRLPTGRRAIARRERRDAGRQRAHQGARRARATGLPAIADDTGLEIDALNGAPGVRSARYAGPDATYAENVARLLRELSGVPRERGRRAFAPSAWRCSPMAASGSPRAFSRAGSSTRREGAAGSATTRCSSSPDGRTLAELSAGEKNAISHRTLAIRALAKALRGV